MMCAGSNPVDTAGEEEQKAEDAAFFDELQHPDPADASIEAATAATSPAAQEPPPAAADGAALSGGRDGASIQFSNVMSGP